MRDPRAEQKAHWDNVAAHWEKWFPVMETGIKGVTDALLDLAKVSQGDWVLDVGTGVGEPACTIAGRVGADGKVVGIDVAPRMVALAEKRAKALGLKNVSFQTLDGEQLGTWAAESYNGCVSRLGLMFMANVGAGLKGIRHVLTKGGRLAAAVWAPRPRVPFLGLIMDVVEEVLAIEPPPAAAPGGFALSEPGLLEKRMTEAGFRDPQGERLTITVEFPSAADYVTFAREVSSIADVVRKAPTDVQAEVWQKLEAKAKEQADPEGKVGLNGEVLLVVGRK